MFVHFVFVFLSVATQPLETQIKFFFHSSNEWNRSTKKRKVNTPKKKSPRNGGKNLESNNIQFKKRLRSWANLVHLITSGQRYSSIQHIFVEMIEWKEMRAIPITCNYLNRCCWLILSLILSCNYINLMSRSSPSVHASKSTSCKWIQFCVGDNGCYHLGSFTRRCNQRIAVHNDFVLFFSSSSGLEKHQTKKTVMWKIKSRIPHNEAFSVFEFCQFVLFSLFLYPKLLSTELFLLLVKEQHRNCNESRHQKHTLEKIPWMLSVIASSHHWNNNFRQKEEEKKNSATAKNNTMRK